MKKKYLVLGLGRFGVGVVKTLAMMDQEVYAVDSNSDNVDEVAQYATRAEVLDVTNEQRIVSLNVNCFDCVIIAVGNIIGVSALATLICKSHGAKYIVAKASDELHKNLLLQLGANKVIMPEQDGGERLAKQLVSGNFMSYLEISDGCSVKEVVVPKDWIGKSIIEIDVRKKYKLSIIAIVRATKTLLSLDPSSTRFVEDDVIVVVGSNASIAKIEASNMQQQVTHI